MTENSLDKHRLTQIQWHLCTEEEEDRNAADLEKYQLREEIRKSLNEMFFSQA